MFKPGFYYVGDPGFILPSKDLRMLFQLILHGRLKTGAKRFLASERIVDGIELVEQYWVCKTPMKTGTVYDQENKGWGVDWYCFGAVPWEWIDNKHAYHDHRIEFTETFECLATDEGITIGHLQFTFN